MVEAALITGASGMLGQAIARALGQAGYALALHAHSNLGAAEALATEIRAAGGRAVALRSDLGDPLAAAALVPDAVAALGPLTLLVNVAISRLPDDLLSLDVPTWNRQFSVNIRAPSVLAGAFATQLPENVRGCILLRLDQRRWQPAREAYSFSLSQAAMLDATRIMARALAPRIRVNAFGHAPDMTSADHLDQSVNNGHVALVAATMLYLAKAQAVTGQVMVV